MKKRSNALLLTLCVLSTLFNSGCWDYSEYESMAQIIATGVDYNKKTKETVLTFYYTTATQPNNSRGTGSSNNASGSSGITNTTTDKTFYGAITKAQQVITKKLFYGYMKVIVIGEEAAKNNILDLMELFDRTSSIRTTTYIVITPGKAQNIISTVDPSNTTSIGEQLFEQINSTGSAGTAFPVEIQDFSEMLAIGGWEASAPRVISTAQNSQEPIAMGGTHDDIRLDQKMNGGIVVSGIAAFKEDKFVGWLNEKESMGYGWITGKNIHGYKYSEASETDNTEDILYFRIDSSKSKIKVKLDNNIPIVHVNIKVTADLRKYYSKKGAEFFTPDEISQMKKKLSDSIRSDVMAALEKCQKDFNSDIFGFGFAFFRKYPKLWQTTYEKKWSDIFPDTPVEVSVDTKIINTGTNIKKFILK